MANKLRLVSELASQKAREVTQSARNWEQYLDTASRLYKYPFDEQLLIYAQRPDATACASMELWNGTMRRWVRAGSTGIALIRKSGGRPHLEYVFDVADTRPVQGAREPKLWELREEHYDTVVAALERRYGTTEENGIVGQLMDLAEYAVREVCQDHLRDLAYDAEGSLLEGLDDLNLEVRFRRLMTASVQYTLLRRCGLNPSDFMEDDDLEGITEFTTPAVLHHLGEAVSTVSMELLNEIGRAIRACERDTVQAREKNVEKPLANRVVDKYNKIGFLYATNDEQERSATHERNEHDGADVHEGRGLSDSRSGDGRRGGSDAAGQVRDAARDIPEGAASRDVHLDAADREAGTASAGDRPAGAGAGGQDRERSDEAEQRERGAESQRSDGLGAGGQQLHGAGRGDGAGGDRLQVTTEQAVSEAAGDEPAASPSEGTDVPDAEEPAAPMPRFALFPSVEEQVEAITEARSEGKRMADTPVQIRMDGADRIPDAVIGRALTTGSNERNSIKRIVAHFQKEQSLPVTLRFLKEEFGEGGKGVTIAGQKYALWYDRSGVHIAAGNRALVPGSTVVNWIDAERIITDLLHQGMFATQEKIDGARENELTELAEKLWYLHQDLSEEAREQGYLPTTATCYGHGFPEDTLQIVELLRKPESREAITSEVQDFSIAFSNNRDLLRFPRIHDPHRLWTDLLALERPITQFQAVDGFEPVRASFITEDEIDALLQKSGNHVSDMKMRIVSYILQGHNAVECADFIRREYGIGGFGYIGYNEWHDSKGVRFRRGDDSTDFKDYDEVFFNWNQVYKRVRQLMDDGKYLNSKEQAYLHDYEMKMLARNVYAFQYYTDPTPQMNRTWDVEEGIKPIFPILEDPVKAKELYDQMLNTWMPLRPDFPHYDALRVPLRDMGFYVRGEYSLFKPLPEKVLQAERDLAEARKKAKQEARQAGMVEDDDEGYLESGEGEGMVDLKKAARALARKQKPKENEDASGQFNLFGGMIEGEQASMFDAEPEQPAPAEIPASPATPAPKKKVVVEKILSPDLERERRQIEEAREKAAAILAERGVEVTDAMMKDAVVSAGREAVFPDRLVKAAEAYLEREIEKKYSLGYGYFGNGLTVWNNLEYEHGDYKTIAHIDADRTVQFYDENLPEIIKEKIRLAAATSEATISATQDTPIFSVPPLPLEQVREKPAPEQPEAYTTPDGIPYHVGDSFDSYDELGKPQTRFQLTDVDEDYIHYTFPDLPEQAPVEMRRESFELYLDRGVKGGFVRAADEPVQRDAPQPEQSGGAVDGQFEYQGYHFEPVGMFPADWQKDAGHALVSDPNLGISGYFGSKHPYSHGAFYAAGGTTADIFRCVENGKYYIPGENELFEYAGEFDPLRREAERPAAEKPESIAATEQPAQEKKRPGNSRVERNYRSFARQFPEIVSGEYRYLELRGGEGSGYMPLIIQRIGEDEISVAHTYLQNGDVMYDPEMTFRIDNEKGTLEPLTYQQDAMGLYQQVYPEPGKWIPKLRNDLSAFTEQWLNNISQQSRAKYRAVAVRDGEDQEIFFSNDRVDRPLDYKTVKEDHADDLVAYQVGDFFELYGEDAKEAASLLDLTLTTVGNAERGRVEMCGFPAATAEKYIEALRARRDVTVCAVDGADGTRSVRTLASTERERDKVSVMDYDAVKFGHPEELVLYQVGDNFELRGEDAKTAARLLKLTAKDGQSVDYDAASTVSFSVHANAEMEVLRRTHGIVVCTVNEDGEQEIRAFPSLAMQLTDFFRAYTPEEYKGKSDAEALSETVQQLGDTLIVSEMISQISLIIPEENMTPEQLAEANGLIDALKSILPEELRRDFEDKPQISSEAVSESAHPYEAGDAEFTPADLDAADDDLQEVLVGDSGLLELKDKEQIAAWFRAGESNAQIEKRMALTYAGVSDTLMLLSGDGADYFVSANGIEIIIADKYDTKLHFSWAEIVPVLRAMYEQERDGFFHEPVLPEPEATAADAAETETAASDADVPTSPDEAPESTGAGAPATEEGAKRAEPNLVPNVEQYIALKAQHSDKLVGVQVDTFMLFYGKDAVEAARALGTNVISREIPGLGQTTITGMTQAWQATIKKLLEHGQSAVLARPDAEHGADAPYEVITEGNAAEYIPIGLELTVEGRRMKIDSVDFENGKVQLQDMELRGWYPIFRTENIPFVRGLVEEYYQSEEYGKKLEAQYRREAQEAEATEDAPAPLPEAPEQIEIDGGRVAAPPAPTEYRERTIKYIHDERIPFDIEIRTIDVGPERRNFHITDDNLGAGGQKTKYQNNVAAIRTLKQIEAESRLATPEEQETLSRYVGWGGLAQAFDPNNEKWAKEYAELKELLTPEEYESARGTVLNAHYTSPTVIKAIYDAVERMDFQPGNVLEPACGIGNFFGLLPEGMSDARLYGVELDKLTGRIAQQLYQQAEITVDGFENTDHPDDFFDLAVGNVPFGEYHVHDKRYDKQNLLVHDYFITKTLDKVRPGGIVAFITSKGTMDKKNSKVREALAQKADLLGAIRLPNNAFKANAGTEVTTDILFFQRRDRAPEKLPEWVESGETEDGIQLNSYYLAHPEMVLGTMVRGASLYGNDTETACEPIEGAVLSEQLAEAVKNIAPPNRELLRFYEPGQDPDEAEVETIPADPDVRNFSYTMKGSKTYFRENSRMKRVELGKTPTQRVRGMIEIRDSARKLIDLQLNGASDEEIKAEQVNLNKLYDQFTKKYGLLSGAGNRLAFNQDSSYPLLCSLEVLDDEGNLERKADMFTKRTIQQHRAVTSVDTAAEALAVSIGERACVDLGYMAQLMGGAEKIPQIVEDLKGVIFKDPASGTFDLNEENGTNWYKGWQTADEYLSGNVRQKLEQARVAAEMYPEFAVNAEALEKVQPKELSASEISVRVGAPWIKPDYYRQFIFELLQTPGHIGKKIGVLHSKATDEWRITNKGIDIRDNALIYSTYGSKRRSAYEIFENMLNQRDTRVYDTKWEDGKEVRVLNVKETAIAGQKQEAIAMAFQNWIFKDPERRADLVATYNRLFNSTRPREYNGEHIRFAGMNPEIRLEPHQRNAVARMLYGGNALLAHCVGAGKTFEMTAAAMESKRLGLCQKSLFVVPNHLTEQWGGDFLQLYPGAKVLVATKKDFEPKNRRKFCARIATGDYDAVIIGHSQFEKIPLSLKRQKAILEDQIGEIMAGIAEAKAAKEENFTIKQMERTRKNLEAKLKKLNDKKKDDTVTFEELGVDRLFVDEAHYYKNLFMFTKMRNVAGISQTEAQKSSDMFAKCRYLDELTGGKGVTFATGTPISNTMVELYTMMRYLQFGMLEEHGLSYFDDWAATFGEKVTSVELKPEGTGFRAKTRFARFFNLPELMNLWKEAADIQTADMLHLPVPEAEYITLSTEPSAAQKEMVKALADRAEKVRAGDVDPSKDNMLKITSDGRKLALDQRIANPLLPDDPNSKVNTCVSNVFNIWQETTAIKGAQLIFSDLSTPKGRPEPTKGKGKADADVEENPDEQAEDEAALVLEMSVYEDIRTKLVAKGVPPEQIAFIHEAHTEAQKAEMFAKVRAGQIRILLGSTQKMGAGTNVQTHLVASHDLDCPWRPADLEQRAGRIVRRGNENGHVRIFRYVTKGTFDAYNWGLVENKQKFIGQVMTSKSPARSIEDVDATALSYAEVKMIATGDPRIKEKMDLDIQVARLKMLKANHTAMQYDMEDKVIGYFPRKIKEAELFIEALSADLPILEAHPTKEDAFSMTVLGTTYTERKDAGQAIVNACMLMTDPDKPVELGEYRGFPMTLRLQGEKFQITMKQHLTYTAELSNDLLGNIVRINNALEQIPKNLEAQKLGLSTLQTDMESAKEEAARPFPQDKELEEKSARLSQLNLELDNEEKSQGKSAEATEDAPARDGADEEDTPPEKPSIRAQLRAFNPPARAAAGAERAYSREAAL